MTGFWASDANWAVLARGRHNVTLKSLDAVVVVVMIEVFSGQLALQEDCRIHVDIF